MVVDYEMPDRVLNNGLITGVVLNNVVMNHAKLGLPTLDLGIPGLSSLRPFPGPPSFPFPGGPHPLNQLGGLGSTVSFPSGVWGKAPADK